MISYRRPEFSFCPHIRMWLGIKIGNILVISFFLRLFLNSVQNSMYNQRIFMQNFVWGLKYRNRESGSRSGIGFKFPKNLSSWFMVDPLQ